MHKTFWNANRLTENILSTIKGILNSGCNVETLNSIITLQLILGAWSISTVKGKHLRYNVWKFEEAT